MEIGYHASHEQFGPAELRDFVCLAERSGFGHAMCSDHFHPWSPSQGHSAFSWAWLGAALEASTMGFGTVTPPIGFRYHPALIAQAVGTLSQMYPDRFQWLAIGTGEALNEHIVGRGWPPKAERNEMLAAAAEIIKSLWAGEAVSRAAPIPVDEAMLYCRPQTPPLIFAAALTPQSVSQHAAWADGLLTVNQPPDELEKVIKAYREGGGNGKPLYLQVHLSWAETDDGAIAQALENWRANIVDAGAAAQLRMPDDFDAVTQTVRGEDLDGRILCSSSLEQHVEWLKAYSTMGFERLYLHFVGPDQARCIKAFSEHVVPRLQ